MSHYIRYCLILCVAFVFSCSSHGHDTKQKIKNEKISSYISRWPELKWLGGEVTQTQEGRATQSSNSKASMLVFGEKHDEFDRTIQTLLNLSVILDGSEEAYREFTQSQKETDRLSNIEFKELCELGNEVVQGQPVISEAIESALILGDMGKTKTARDAAKKYKVTEPDHDHFLRRVLEECPQIFPSYEKLSVVIKDYLKKELNVHIGHVTHLEGGPSMLRELKESNLVRDFPSLFKFYFFVHICDVSGALAHVCDKGTIVYTSSTHKALKAIYESLLLLTNHSEDEALLHYINQRGEWLGFNTQTSEGRVLTRLGCMLRFFKKEEGEILQKSYNNFDDETKKIINTAFDPVKSYFGRTPTYVPAVFVNLLSDTTKKLGQTVQDRVSFIIKYALPFVVKVIKNHEDKIKKLKDKADSKSKTELTKLLQLTLCFNDVARQVKEDPLVLINGNYFISPDGIVSAVN